MRMRAMRALVSEFNAYKWIGEMLTDAARVRARLPSAALDACFDQLTPSIAG